MSTSFYCDTSALVKLYHQEVGTERMEELFRQEENVLVISELAIVEFYSTLARKVRVGEITPALRTLDALHLGACLSALPHETPVLGQCRCSTVGRWHIGGPSGTESRTPRGQASRVMCLDHCRGNHTHRFSSQLVNMAPSQYTCVMDAAAQVMRQRSGRCRK